MSSPSQVSSGPPLPTERVPSSTCSPWGLGSCYSHHILENHRTVVSTSSIPLTPKFHPNDPFSQGYAPTPFLLFKTALPSPPPPSSSVLLPLGFQHKPELQHSPTAVPGSTAIVSTLHLPGLGHLCELSSLSLALCLEQSQLLSSCF